MKPTVRELVVVATVNTYLPAGRLRPCWRRLSVNVRVPASAACANRRVGEVLAQAREPEQRIETVTESSRSRCR